ncbi:MAG: amino acid permease [Sedimentisphaerales bacterium]|nr:amino acid permease [Sedimentisphaerales bacterium]
MNLRRDLSLLGIFCIASGAMISSGLFILPGLAYARAGPAVIFCYLLAGILSLPGMLSIAEMTTAMPKAGGDCFAVVRSLGPVAGTVAGLLSWFSLAMKTAFALVGMSIFTRLIVDADLHLLSIFFCAVFLVINLVGVKRAGYTQVALVVALLGLMVLYVAAGLGKVRVENLAPFAPNGPSSIFFTTGFVFVSYAGLLQIASVAEEIKDPARNIPLAMIMSLLVVSILYSLMVLVTAGVLEPAALSRSLTPISDGAEAIMGRFGRIALSLAAVFAFLSTANAGLMAAARSLVPLSRDNLIPEFFGRINQRFRTPHNSLIVTALVIAVAVLLQLDMLIEAASVVLILTNVLSCLSVIILRESRVQNYQPKFRAPLYPWMQIAGIIGFGFLLFEMGVEALTITGILALGGFFTYWFYGRIRTTGEYALLHLIERITARELTSHSLEAELREIIRERDRIKKDRFDEIIERACVLDIEDSIRREDLFKMVGEAMSPRLSMEPERIVQLLMERENESSTVLSPYLAVPHIVIGGEGRFDILLARCRKGAYFSETDPTVRAVFVIMGTKDERNFHLHALSAIAQTIQDPHFEVRWANAKTKENIRDILLLGERRRLSPD